MCLFIFIHTPERIITAYSIYTVTDHFNLTAE